MAVLELLIKSKNLHRIDGEIVWSTAVSNTRDDLWSSTQNIIYSVQNPSLVQKHQGSFNNWRDGLFIKTGCVCSRKKYVLNWCYVTRCNRKGAVVFGFCLGCAENLQAKFMTKVFMTKMQWAEYRQIDNNSTSLHKTIIQNLLLIYSLP